MTQVNEDNNNDITPEVKAQFSSFIEPFFSKYHRERCYPGLILRQYTCWRFSLPLSHKTCY
jgi:DNA sulfur modification protein DndB